MKSWASDLLKIKVEKRFKKDIERDKKSGKYTTEDFEKLKGIIKTLQGKKPVEPIYKGHKLHGQLKEYETIHIKNDWVLIFKIEESFLILVMLGTYSQAYKK